MNIESTVSGIVLQVLVAPGDPISIDQEVAIIESMKMEIPVLATEDGEIVEFAVDEGEPVSEGQVVVVLET